MLLKHLSRNYCFNLATEKPKPKKSKHCPKMDGIFPNSANCSTFYFCVDGTAYLQECPQGLVFDENNVKCDFPKVVGCERKLKKFLSCRSIREINPY